MNSKAQDDTRWQNRGFGVDSAILNSCFYIGQLVVAFCVGGIIEAAGNRSAAVLFSGICYVAAGLMAFTITIIPKNDCKDTEKEVQSSKLEVARKETTI